ncbi:MULTISPECIES: hypothetical protein [Streptomyces]|uniref:hypothetical protein n=1 Tax=Streptomyces TaxID=1883 RepID=UPI0002F03D64|nr:MULTISPECIES: hypothetical protein [Streptomyces]
MTENGALKDKVDRQLPSAEIPTFPQITGNEVYGDLLAGFNVTVTKYITQLAHLEPHAISRSGILSSKQFECPAEFDDALQLLTPGAEDNPGASVLVLVVEPGSGARTTALRLLDELLPEKAEIYELFPDWDSPDVSRIPREKRCGYLLNLSAEGEALTETFRNGLNEYAALAREQGTYLIVLASARVWGTLITGTVFPTPPLVPLRMGRPNAAGITERWLRTRFDASERIAWLHDDSLFTNLLSPTTPPHAAVRLAEVIKRADHRKDERAVAAYQGWDEKLKEWFGSSDDAWVPRRALYIATAFLEGAPSRAVLDSADLLLSAEDVGWPPDKGGVLAGPDAKTRCDEAGISFLDDSTISVNHKYPGIAQALLRHVWRTRPQLIPVLTRWLGHISSPKCPGSGHLDRLAAALTALAESEGAGVVLDRVEQWVKEDSQRSLAVRVLDDLAVHPRIGPSVRDRLSDWSKAPTMPDRQQAVADICRRRFGTEYTRVALNRLRKVLDTSTEAEPGNEAMSSLADLLTAPNSMGRTLAALVGWATAPTPSGSAFVRLLSLTSDGEQVDTRLVNHLLTQEGARGAAVLGMLRDGWQSTWRRADSRPLAAAALDGWCSAVESGLLPQEPIEAVISAVFEEESSNPLNGDLHRIVGGSSPLRRALLDSYVRSVRGAAARNRTPSPAPLP